MDLELLERTLAERGEPAYRSDQVWEWASRGASGYEEMTNLPSGLRSELDSAVPYSTLALSGEARASDGTVKALFETVDGRPVEAVLMRYRDGRRSICVSSQSGCPLTCTFCATGAMKFARNLTAAEVVDQALHFRRLESIDHCVFMGMGEPMMNLDAVLEACRRLPDLGITHRRTAISTVGWIPGIERLTEELMPIRLALSLHAPDDELRSRLMPVNDRYPLAEVLEACRAYHRKRRRRVFVEYVMLAGVNDSPAQAKDLARLLDPRVFKVNLIPYNPTDGGSEREARGPGVVEPAYSEREARGPGVVEPAYSEREARGPGVVEPAHFEGSERSAIHAFRAMLERGGLRATVRLTRGREIAAACGQLAAAQSPSSGGSALGPSG